jgi:hypothetical protein
MAERKRDVVWCAIAPRECSKHCTRSNQCENSGKGKKNENEMWKEG